MQSKRPQVGFIAKRRREVSAFAAAAEPTAPLPTTSFSLPSSSARCEAAWHEDMDKEVKFLQEKRFDNLVEAVLDGSVDPRRLTVSMLDLVVREVRRRQHEAGKDERKEARQAARAADRPPLFSGQKYVVEETLAVSLGEAFFSALAAQYPTATRVWDYFAATAFIVTDVVQYSKSIAWAVGLLGAAVMDVE